MHFLFILSFLFLFLFLFLISSLLLFLVLFCLNSTFILSLLLHFIDLFYFILFYFILFYFILCQLFFLTGCRLSITETSVSFFIFISTLFHFILFYVLFTVLAYFLREGRTDLSLEIYATLYASGLIEHWTNRYEGRV